MPTVFIPTMLQDLTGGQKQLEVPGETVADLIGSLEAAHPGLKARLTDGAALRSNLAVAINGEVSPLGLLEDVPEDAEVHFIPAISGGSGRRKSAKPRPRLRRYLMIQDPSGALSRWAA